MMLRIRTGGNDKSRKSGMVWEKIIEGGNNGGKK